MASPSPPHFPAGIPPLGFEPSGWSSAWPQRHRALCTSPFDPRSSSGTFDAGLVTVAGASFLPLLVNRCRAASPDVVQVSADEGVARRAVHNHALKVKTECLSTGDSEAKMGTKTVKIMTYNVWFKDLERCTRMHALGDLIQQHNPDLICLQVQIYSNHQFITLFPSEWPSYVVLQEVTPVIYQLLQKCEWWREYKCSLSPKMAKHITACR
ncbi:hypothetical protein ACQ4PT_006738 [Festuca glaucescens]